MKIEQVMKDYAAWHEGKQHSPNTIAWYRWILGTFSQWLQDNDRPTHIAEITIGDLRAFMLAEGRRDRLCPDHPTGVERAGRLSDRTLHCYSRALKAFFNWCVAEEYLTRSPAVRLQLPKLEKRFKEVVSVPEIERLLAEVNKQTFLGSRMFAVMSLMYDSGLRISEVVKLDMNDVFWGDHHVRVKGKGKKQRLVPFSFVTLRALRKYEGLREKFAHENSAAFIISARGERLSVNGLRHAIKRLGKRVGVERLHPHLLRHSFAVAYLMNGGNQLELKRILGHEDLSTTDIYADYATQMLQQQHRRFSPMSKVKVRSSSRRKQRQKV